MSLKTWSDDEWEHGRRVEMKALNVAVPTERRDMELATANIAVDAPFSVPDVVPEAILSYDLGARLAHSLSQLYLRRAFAAFLGITAIRMTWDVFAGA